MLRYRCLAPVLGYVMDSPLHLIHIDDDDTVGCVGSPVVDGLHQQHTNKNKYLLAKKRWCQRAIAKIDIFGLV